MAFFRHAPAPGDALLTSAALIRRWIVGLVLINLFAALMAALWLRHSHDEDIRGAATSAQNLAKVLEQDLLGTVGKVDLALLAAADEYGRASAIDAPALEKLLARLQSRLPELASLRIADAGGAVRHGAGATPAVNIADRDFFAALRDDPAAGLAVSKPVFARITKAWVIVFARRLNRADGSFGGVVYANLAIKRLGKIFAALDVGHSGTIVLRDGDLGIIARQPEPQGVGSIIGNRQVSPAFRSRVEAGETGGTFSAAAALDGVERTYAFRRIGPHPLYVVVGLAHDDVLADWREEVAWVSTLLALFFLSTLLASWLAFRAWQREIESRERLRTIVATEPECVKVLAPDGALREMNRAGLDTIEADSLAQVAGRNMADLIVPAHRAAFAALGEKVGQGGSGELAFEIVGLKGGRRWLETHAAPLRNEAGRITGLLGVTRDVTERKRIEQALLEAEERFHAAFSSAAIGMALVAADGRFLEANAALCGIVGYAAAELREMTFQEITYPDDLATDLAYARRLAAGEITSYQMEKRYFHKDGHIVWILLTGSSVRDEQGGLLYFVAQIQDISERKRIDAALRKSKELLKEAQRIAQIGSWELDLVSHELTWSDETFRIFEIAPAAFGASYDAFLAAIHPDDRERVGQAYEASVKNHLPYAITHRLLLPDGVVKYVHEHCETHYAADGKPLRSIGTVQDVTLHVLNEEALRESEERFRTMADYTYDWEYWQGPQGEFLYISPSCSRVTGYAQGEFIADPDLVYQIIHPDDRHLMDAHRDSIAYEDAGSLDFRIVAKDGDVRWIAHGCRAVYAKDGRFLGRRVSNRDITDRKNAEMQIEQLAFYDALTDLPNRRMLLDRLGQALSQAKRYRRSLAIMFLDLDNFKQINDRLGHDVGDGLLQEVASRLRTCVRTGDTVSRQGGDEFIIVLAEVAEAGDAARVAEKIIKALGEPMRIGDNVLNATISIGIAVYPVDGSDDALELMKKADKAMYVAKAAGRNGYRFFAG